MAKILILDIETKPNLAYVWRFFKENVGPKQVVNYSSILSFAAKWLGNEEVFYFSSRNIGEKELLATLLELLDVADIVVAHNGKKFDIGRINARALVHKLPPPSPFKLIDTLLVAKNEFAFDSNSLESLADILSCNTRKGSHKKFPGFELWLGCLADNPDAWQELAEYNVLDVLVLEEIYLKMRPWMTKHPNVSLYKEGDSDSVHCPKCGSDHIHFRGYATLAASVYRRFQCQTCRGWGRMRTNVLSKNRRSNLASNIAAS